MESCKTNNSEYYTCSRCNGTGKVYDEFETTRERMCYRCDGEGKLDWIENIFGKKRERTWKEVLDEVINNNLMNEYLKRLKGCE